MDNPANWRAVFLLVHHYTDCKENNEKKVKIWTLISFPSQTQNINAPIFPKITKFEHWRNLELCKYTNHVNYRIYDANP